MKIKNIQTFAFLQNLTKAYTEGVYADTPANRKLGRVGMSYAQYAQKVAGGDKGGEQEQNIKKETIEKETKPTIEKEQMLSLGDIPWKKVPGNRRMHSFDIDDKTTIYASFGTEGTDYYIKDEKGEYNKISKSDIKKYIKGITKKDIREKKKKSLEDSVKFIKDITIKSIDSENFSKWDKKDFDGCTKDFLKNIKDVLKYEKFTLHKLDKKTKDGYPLFLVTKHSSVRKDPEETYGMVVAGDESLKDAVSSNKGNEGYEEFADTIKYKENLDSSSVDTSNSVDYHSRDFFEKKNDSFYYIKKDGFNVRDLNSHQYRYLDQTLKKAKKLGIPLELFTLTKDDKGILNLDVNDDEASTYYIKDRGASDEDYNKQEQLDRNLTTLGFGPGRGGAASRKEINEKLNSISDKNPFYSFES